MEVESDDVFSALSVAVEFSSADVSILVTARFISSLQILEIAA